MKLNLNLAALLLIFAPQIQAVALQQEDSRAVASIERDFISGEFEDLWKRRGGGGGGGKGGGGESGGGESSGSSSSSSSSSSGKGAGSPESSVGGKTTTGSGTKPSYGKGGTYYAGGSTVPYSSGLISPLGITPLLLTLSALSFWHGSLLYGAYMYPYSHPYTYYNTSSAQNETKPVSCLCEQYEECSCDDNGDDTWLTSIVGNGTGLNDTIVQVADYNGTSTIFVNGTLANGTTAAGGTDNPNAALGIQNMAKHAGWLGMVVAVLATVLLA